MAEVSVRRAEHADAVAIRALIEAVGEGDLESRFGTVDVDYIIEHTELSVVAATDEDDPNTIVAFAAFSCRSPQFNTEAWLDYMDPTEYSSLNILWFRFVVADGANATSTVASLIKSTYITMSRTDHLVLCQDENKALPMSMEGIMTPIKVDHGHPTDFNLFGCVRNKYVAELHIRDSLVEDNDALAPIFERQMKELTTTFGDFYLADIISSQNDNKKCLTAEVEGQPVGLMSFSSDIQVGMLQKCFDLRPYSNLLKTVAEEEVVVEPDWCACLMSHLEELSAQIGGSTVDFSTLSAAITNSGGEWKCKPEKIGEMLSRVITLGRSFGASLTWAELEAALRVYAARQTVWTWYKSKEGGRQVLFDLHRTSKGSKDDMLDLLEKQRPGLSAACDAGFNFDGIEKVEDLINYDDLIVTEKEVTDGVDQFELAMSVYNGYKTTFFGVNSPTKLAIAARIAAASGITLVDSAHERTTEIARIKAEWRDPDTDPPEDLTEEEFCAIVIKRLQQPDCAGGRGFVLIDFPRNKEHSDALLAAGIVIDNHIYVEDDRFEAVETNVSRLEASLANCKTRVGRVVKLSGRMKDEPLYQHVLNLMLESIIITESQKKPEVRTVERVKGNAFAITLFTLDRKYEASAGEFMEKAFALYPNHDYCIITRPHTAADIWLLQNFTRVNARPKSTFSHVVYLMHRHAVYGVDHLTVVRGKSGDTIGVGRLLKGLDVEEDTAKAFQSSLKCASTRLKDDPEHVTFLAHVNKQIVAVAVLNRSCSTPSMMTDMRERFRLEEMLPAKQHAPAQHAALTHFVVNPIFEAQSRLILSEAMRLYKKSALSYVVRPSAHVLPVASEFVQVQPHKLNQLMYLEKETASWGFGLYVLPQRLLSEPKIVNNTRIVVVGSSDTGLAFLEALLFVPYMQFTHLTLISNSGIATGRAQRLSSPVELLQKPSTFTTLELQQLRIDTNIQVIDNYMVSIDREAKCVVMPGAKADAEELVPYDVLVIASGLRERTDATLQVEEDDLPNGVLQCLDYNVGKAAEALAKAAETGKDGDPVVVYGGTLHALQIVEAAIQAQIPTSRITWVFPSVPNELALPDLLWNTVHKRLLAIGIKVMPKLRISSVAAEGNELTGVVFKDSSAPQNTSDEGDMLMSWQPRESKGDDESQTTVAASLLLCAARPDVDADVFYAVNESGLVYDGRIVVDSQFRTVDKNIFSGGTITKFSRRLRPKSNQEAYSSREVGTKLAVAVLQQVDALSQPVSEEQESNLPTFNLPRMKVYRLPGGLHFTCSVIAERPPPHETLMTKFISKDGTEMRYTCVTLDRHQRAAKLTYLGTAEVEERNLTRLVGCHESFLNSLKHAHDVGSCHDFIQYFRQPWADALYSHHFEEFVENMHRLIQDDKEVDKVVKKMRSFKMGRDGQRLDRVVHAIHDTVGLGGCKLAPSTRKVLQQAVVNFVTKHHKLLSLYWIPDQTPGEAKEV